jgi:hypothetical protein
MRRIVAAGLAVITCTLLPPAVLAGPGQAKPTDEPKAPVVEHGWGHKLLLYLPNRLLDVADVFRARLRVGPGWAIEMQATQRLSFFGGNYRSVYLGLPGPRAPKKFVSPVGKEGLKGIVFMGVDATDVTSHPPGYSISEITAGGHLLIVGADVGLDFWEVADFFTGLVFIDLRKDDL